MRRYCGFQVGVDLHRIHEAHSFRAFLSIRKLFDFPTHLMIVGDRCWMFATMVVEMKRYEFVFKSKLDSLPCMHRPCRCQRIREGSIANFTPYTSIAIQQPSNTAEKTRQRYLAYLCMCSTYRHRHRARVMVGESRMTS